MPCHKFDKETILYFQQKKYFQALFGVQPTIFNFAKVFFLIFFVWDPKNFFSIEIEQNKFSKAFRIAFFK